MTVDIRYSAKEKFTVPYRKIIKDAVGASLEAEQCPYETEVSVTITDGPGIRRLNRTFRDTDRETDVLSFPFLFFKKPAGFDRAVQKDSFNPENGELLLGEIVLNVEKVKKQAAEYGHSESRELAFLTVHSMLHLMGYDHMKEKDRILMEKRQKEILESRGYTR